MIYFDNAASTYKKPFRVKWATLKAITCFTANPGRSGHPLSFKAAIEVYKVRKHLQQFFHADSINNVIFTGSCTEALNLAILGCAQEGKHIIVTANEHNSVLRAVEHLAQTKAVRYTVVLPNEQGVITPQAITQAILPDTTMLIVNHTSNVTGATSDIGALGKLAHQKGILFLVDAAQSAGHEPIDLKTQHINLLALAGHKGLMGLQGVGVLLTNGVTPKPIKFGGTGTHSESPIQPTQPPEGLEAGTLPTPNIIALGAGLNYVEKHFSSIAKKITALTRKLLIKLKEMPEIHLYSQNPHSGVVSFEIQGLDSNFVVNELSQHGICTRGGLHCAPLIHKHLHHNTGLIRVSINQNNHFYEIKKFLSVLAVIIQNNQKRI